MPAPQPLCSADIQAHRLRAADTAPHQKVVAPKSAARGSVGGAVIGGIAGDAGTRAAVAQPQAPCAVGSSSAKPMQLPRIRPLHKRGTQVQQQFQSENAAYSRK